MDFNVTFGNENDNEEKVGFAEVVILKGEDGATFTPILSTPSTDTLRIEWTNDKGLENPEPIEIIAPKGNSFSYEDFTSEQLNGLKPKRGIDYFTEEDLEQWKNEVITTMEDELIGMLASADVVQPIADENGAIYTDENGALYIL